MKIAGKFSFNNGEDYINKNFLDAKLEIESCIKKIKKSNSKKKISKEKTMKGKKLYSPVLFNEQFKKTLSPLGWNSLKVNCEYSKNYYTEIHKNPKPLNQGAFRDMDFVKNRLGVEVQFGKYAFMAYNVCAKMTIFKNLDHIDAGIEIVPLKELADEMSSGVSYFEQFVWDLETRGTSNIDIPVLILGIC